MKSTLLNMVLSLGIITIVAAGLLSWIFTITEEPIEKANLQKQTEAVSAVTPEFNNNPVDEVIEITPAGEDTALKVFPARKDGKLVGAAVESYSTKGFSGNIKLVYGFELDGTIHGYAVMEHAETPGLGAKMDTWFGKDGKGNVVGLNPTQGALTVSKDGGQVDAITAATITSRAFLDALNRASDAFTQLVAAEK